MSINRVMTIATDAVPSRHPQRAAAWLAAALLAAGLLASPATANETKSLKHAPTKNLHDVKSEHAPTSNPNAAVLRNGIRLEDEIEVVNTRSICSCTVDALRNGVKFETFAVCDDAGTRKWQASNLEKFVAFDASVPTIIFVHGNQITPFDAKDEGLFAYRKMILQECNAPKIRFVIFSWPSMKTPGLLRDV